MSSFFIAMILGNAFLGIYTGVLAHIGQSTGLTLYLLARHSFGIKGSYLPSTLISFTQIGWFGVGVAMFALPVGVLLAVWATIIAFFIGNSIMFVFGAVGGAVTGNADIFDPWYPLGDGNMRDVVHLGLHVCQMMGYEEILNSYRLITYNAAKTLKLNESYGIKEGSPASFIVLNAE